MNLVSGIAFAGTGGVQIVGVIFIFFFLCDTPGGGNSRYGNLVIPLVSPGFMHQVFC